MPYGTHHHHARRPQRRGAIQHKYVYYGREKQATKHLVVAVLSHCSTHAMHDRRAFSHLFLVRKRFCELFNGNLAIPVFVRLLAYALEHELGCFEIPVSTIS